MKAWIAILIGVIFCGCSSSPLETVEKEKGSKTMILKTVGSGVFNSANGYIDFTFPAAGRFLAPSPLSGVVADNSKAFLIRAKVEFSGIQGLRPIPDTTVSPATVAPIPIYFQRQPSAVLNQFKRIDLIEFNDWQEYGLEFEQAENTSQPVWGARQFMLDSDPSKTGDQTYRLPIDNINVQSVYDGRTVVCTISLEVEAVFE